MTPGTASTTANTDEVRFTREGGQALLITRQFLPLPREEVFAFFEDPRNLARITPPWLCFRILDPQEVEMKLGARIEYTIRWLGIPLRWITLITGYQPPGYFEDSQVRGPYALWVHQHRFREADGGTWVEDRVAYRAPLGPLGRLAESLIVTRQLRQIFEYRTEKIRELLLK